MTDPIPDVYGFTWGPVMVTRMARFRASEMRETFCLRVSTDVGKSIEIYVSRTGRSLRVFRDGEELK